MHHFQAVITDLDGTVLGRDKRPSPATVRAVGELTERGIALLVATARTPAWVGALQPLISFVDVAVCCGGAIGWAPGSRRVLWRDVLSPDDVRSISQMASRRSADAGIAVYDGDRWYVTQAFADRGPARPGGTEVVAAEQLAELPACALSVHVRDAATLLPELPRDLTAGTPVPDLIDVAPAGTDKAGGVRRGLQALGTDPATAIAFGDDIPDIPMFDVCGRGIAVANAHPDVLAAADTVTSCVHDDGVARMLAHLGLTAPYRATGEKTTCSCPHSGQQPSATDRHR